MEKYTNERIEGQMKRGYDEALEKLKAAGNIKEAALVVSYSGMELLATIIGNTIRQEVKRAVDESNRELLEGMLVGMYNMASPVRVEPKVEDSPPEEYESTPEENFRNKKRHTWTADEDAKLIGEIKAWTDLKYPAKFGIDRAHKKYFRGMTIGQVKARYNKINKKIKEEQGL